MYKSKVLVSIIIMLYVLFTIFELNGNDIVSYRLDCLIVPVITLLYMLTIKKKNKYFVLFLLFYSLSDLIALIIDFIPNLEGSLISEFYYFIGNSLYIIAYVFLFRKTCNSLCILQVLKNFKIHIFVLLVLNIYLIYVLQVIVKPNVVLDIDYYLELVYNIVTFLLLSSTLLNYFYRDNKKSLYLFVGTLFIVFSEVMDIAYIYIAQRSVLSVVAATFSLLAFYFFYQQSKMINVQNEEGNYMTIK